MINADVPAPSEILRHPKCDDCAAAYAWFTARAQLTQSAGSVTDAVSWLLEEFEWGPVVWPVHWCDILETEYADCGVMAAMSRYCLSRRGFVVFPAQAVLRVTNAEVSKWRHTWDENPGSASKWIISETLVYHEIILLRDYADNYKAFDSTEMKFISEGDRRTGGVIAIRLPPSAGKSVAVVWSRRVLAPGCWVDLEAEPPEEKGSCASL